MVEIDFSYIYDLDGDDLTWAALIDEFSAQQDVKVNLKKMIWDTAWAELFAYTSQSDGPHVSHVGNTWVGSLARMNALRPFKSDEIAAVGGDWDFVSANWEAGLLPYDKRVWSIPWTSWIYVICYRKDLLAQVGIDPAQAFGTLGALQKTVQKLSTSPLEIPWINSKFYVAPTQDLIHATARDLMHIAASWIWAAGGDFLSKDGTKILFNSESSIAGLKAWLETFRAVPDEYKNLSQRQSLDLFREGRAAAVLTNIYRVNLLMRDESNPLVHDNLGVASVTEVPWTGGGSMVIWEHARTDPQQERAAVELVKFLASKDVNLHYHQQAGSLPARMDALKETYPEGSLAHQAVLWAATKGRGYQATLTWRRVEPQLSNVIGLIVNEATENPSKDLDAILHAYLDPLANRLSNIAV